MKDIVQDPPRLSNQYTDDRVLKTYLDRVLPEEVRRAVEPSLLNMGELAADELFRLQSADRLNEPMLTQWDAWGNRIDRIEPTPLWKRAEHLAAEEGVVATAYERRHGCHSRVHQFALAYLFYPSTDVYSCPLAMTDGAARTLLASGNARLIERAVPRLTTRDPERFWTSGQWMTELAGGSDVGGSRTVAEQDKNGAWRLTGRKWFTSAASAQMALTLARPVGNPPGGRGLALFYLETRDAAGKLQGIRLERLKDKLGTRKLPTAELVLDGAPAELVDGPTNGVRGIAPMLNITRIWNGVSAVAIMRRGLALARDYAGRRMAFGSALLDKPLHQRTLADLQAEFEGAFHLTFHLVERLGRQEAEETTSGERRLLRALTPIMKLTTAKQAVSVTSEILECFGGAGYVEDTGLPVLLRDAQVLSIWEGTTNVLSLEALRALNDGDTFDELISLLRFWTDEVDAKLLSFPVQAARATLRQVEQWWQRSGLSGGDEAEASARQFALTLGRVCELVLLCRQAIWSSQRGDRLPAAAAERLALSRIDLLDERSREHDEQLSRDSP